MQRDNDGSAAYGSLLLLGYEHKPTVMLGV